MATMRSPLQTVHESVPTDIKGQPKSCKINSRVSHLIHFNFIENILELYL